MRRNTRGFSAIEILVVIAIFLVLTIVVTKSFFAIKDNQALNAANDDLFSLLDEARTSTLSAKNDVAYGVYITATSATLYRGPTYSGSASTNKVITFDPRVTATSTFTSGRVLFARLTGAASQAGTTTFSLKSNASKTKSIYVGSTAIFDRR